MKRNTLAEVLGNITPAQIGLGLRVARARSQRRAVAVAEALGVSMCTLLRYERGDTPVPAVVMFALAAMYHTTVDAMAADGTAGGA